MAISKAQMKAVSKYEKNNYFKTLVRFPKDFEPKMRELCNQKGISLNGLIKTAVDEYIKNNS